MVVARYDFLYIKFIDFFKDKFPHKDRVQFQALIDEGRLMAKTSLQVVVDAAVTAFRAIVTVVLMRCVMVAIFGVP